MLRTRLWMGAILIALTAGVLVLDQRLAPWYPFLFVLVLLLSLAACRELLDLLGTVRPPSWLCYAAVAALLASNWLPTAGPRLIPGWTMNHDPWIWIAAVFAVVTLIGFITEMAVFRVPGESLAWLSLVVWIAAYLGLLPSFLVQLRWLPGLEEGSKEQRATAALMLAIFVPKCGDIGAY